MLLAVNWREKEEEREHGNFGDIRQLCPEVWNKIETEGNLKKKLSLFFLYFVLPKIVFLGEKRLSLPNMWPWD